MAKSTAKLKRISQGEVAAYMRENGLSSIVAVDNVDGWPYRISLNQIEEEYYILANLIVCNYDGTTQKYNIVNGSDIESVTKVRNLPCDTTFISDTVVDSAMTSFLEGLRTDGYKIDEVTAELRTDNVGNGSGLTYDDLDVTVWIIDEE